MKVVNAQVSPSRAQSLATAVSLRVELAGWLHNGTSCCRLSNPRDSLPKGRALELGAAETEHRAMALRVR